MGHHTPAARWGAQRRFRRACPKGSRGRAKRGEGTMDIEQGPPASSASSTGATATSTNTTSSSTTTSSNSTGRQAVPQISVYSGIPDRQTVQVIQQALHRQPNTAAQYLQQMYAAQQQHLMLQTAALQQQHLSNAQLQSLAAVQQASIAAGRQSSTQNGTSSQQTGSSQATVSAINLTTSPAAAQLISRTQSVSSAPAGSISQQAVLLGSTSSPTTLTASQAHMYLRAQMAQQSNLVQVARSLGRAVPLSPQLIFTPTAAVTAVQSESSTQSSGQQSAPSQVQNLAIRSQQGATMSSFQTHNLQALSLKQTPVAIQPSPLLKNPSQGSRGSGGKGSSSDVPLDGSKKGESIVTEVCAINMSRSITALSGQPLSTPAYTQIHPSHSLVQQHKQQQFVIQQTHASQRTQGQLLQTASIQPHLQTPSLVPQSPSQAGPVPVLPKPASHHQPSTPSQQATIFHSTISPHALHSSLSQTKAQPVQLTAINLQIQPALSQASRLVQDSKGQEKPKSLVVRELCPTPSVEQQPTPFTPSAPSPPQATKPAEQPRTDPVMPISQPQGVPTTKRLNAAPETPPPAMTSGNENEAPTVTGSTPQNGENKPPQAIVKPQVLTHVIEGFVIQEGAEPFPIERLPVMMDSPKKLHEQLSSDPDKTPVSNPTNTTDSETEELTPQELKDQEDSDAPKLRCEFCGWVDFAYKFKGSKRFCSMVCAKRYNVGCTKRIGLFRPERSKASNRWRRRSHNSCRQSVEPKKQKLFPTPQQTQGGSVSSPLPSQPSHEESSPCSDMSSYEEPLSPLSGASSGPTAPQALSHQAGRGSDQEAPRGRELPLLTQHFLPNDSTKWNVEEVYEFIHSLPGCQEIADEFRSQEIDGQAMLLLKEDHLMSAMNIKLGPALKIYAHINMLKDS
ncbi:polyhomeotic-like protein 2 isoform X3 [Oncorhynchus tshawytscha]|uniref:Polyhomeotic-like protein 2 n=2 Tax=Oncorhynchus tshawytscha TaxID=74940 RepID=A0A8C8J6P6_ONCTS|nr:polyhomeotic-like protein 2 isoform X3 [Oncorhynchus tshawytscha]